MNYHDMFNRKFNDFLTDLETTFPSDPRISKIKDLRQMFRMMVTLAPAQMQRYFDQYVAVPYEDEIKTRDERFFMSHDFGNSVEMSLLSDLKDMWANMTDANKKAVWDHLVLLLKLNEFCKNATT